jgi:hypothetical protein
MKLECQIMTVLIIMTGVISQELHNSRDVLSNTISIFVGEGQGGSRARDIVPSYSTSQKQAGYAAAPSKCLHMMLFGFITSLVTLDVAHSKFPIKALNFESISVIV